MSWIKAMGLASPLGPLVPACAAFRAGVSLPSPAPDFETFFPGDEEPGTVSVHALGAPTHGFSGVGRLVVLLAEALADLSSREDLFALNARTGLFLALPDPEKRGFTTGKEPDDEDSEDPFERVQDLADRVVPGALEALGLPWWGGPVQVHHGGNAAFAQALAAADEELREGRLHSALVCAGDSLISPQTLELLNREERLKTGANPTGLMPGEAGVALLLKPRPPPRSTEGPPPVFLRAACLGMEPRSGEEIPSEGRELARCALTALGPLAQGQRLPVLVSDHDGQSHRAHEWGMLQLRLVEGDRRLGDCPVWMPAMSFGHTGAASGGLGVATAFRALQRGYASTSILVLSSSDMGERATLQLAAESPR